MNTNIWDVLVTLFFLVFIVIMFGGTAYLVQKYDWSPWTFIVTMMCIPAIKTGYGKKD